MKHLIAFGLILGLLPGFAAVDPIEIHVAPTGDDAADGTRAKPLASLIGARDALRRLRADGKMGPVRVVVADGTYRFAEALVLRPEDGGRAEAPVRYEAAPGAKPVFSGGRVITGFQPAQHGLWAAKVPDVAAGKRSVKITDAPGLQHTWIPLLVCQTRYAKGVVPSAFNLRVEKASMVDVEWRDYTEGGHKTGLHLAIREAGLRLVGGTTMHLPENQSVRFEIESDVGPDMAGTWSLTVTALGRSPRVFRNVGFANPAFKTLTGAGFMSNADAGTSCYLDNFTLNARPTGTAPDLNS
jgi:hypothetical protein